MSKCAEDAKLLEDSFAIAQSLGVDQTESKWTSVMATPLSGDISLQPNLPSHKPSPIELRRKVGKLFFLLFEGHTHYKLLQEN